MSDEDKAMLMMLCGALSDLLEMSLWDTERIREVQLKMEGILLKLN